MQGSNKYKWFSVVIATKETYSVAVHRLVAYQKFGDAALVEGVVTRHLDGNSLNNDPNNIQLGTPRENVMDMTPDARQKMTKNASYAASHRNDALWKRVIADRRVGLTYSQLRDKYGVSLGSLSYRLSKKAKQRAVTAPE